MNIIEIYLITVDYGDSNHPTSRAYFNEEEAERVKTEYENENPHIAYGVMEIDVNQLF